jgi:hypothetical protein
MFAESRLSYKQKRQRVFGNYGPLQECSEHVRALLSASVRRKTAADDYWARRQHFMDLVSSDRTGDRPTRHLKFKELKPVQGWMPKTNDVPIKGKKQTPKNNAVPEPKKGGGKGIKKGPVVMATRSDLAFGLRPKKEEYTYG